ncbi:MAG: sigma-70 family RNA polymerase sigma factor [Flavobacteriales bacterium]|jgi:RNA polymerase sigma-70 factor (ECF subfamily)|nr:sigma-70 family RNA polymerase sigma factor [Flavobacteriales bacterium]
MEKQNQSLDHLSDKARIDYELVLKAVNQKDQKAFTDLMDRYRDSIFFMLLKMVNNRDDAEDLTIEAFGKAFNRLHQYTPNYAFSTWLFKIATNNCIDFLRKKKKNVLSIDNRLENEDGDAFMIELKSENRNPEEEAIRAQKIQLMRSVVGRLKPRYQILIELRYFKEMSYDEIASELNLPLGTVKAQLFRARDFLFNILKDNKDRI